MIDVTPFGAGQLKKFGVLAQSNRTFVSTAAVAGELVRPAIATTPATAASDTPIRAVALVPRCPRSRRMVE
jgi:hypothetical protein